MLSFQSITTAALAALCVPALAYPTNCDWLGCGLQTPIGETSHHETTVVADIKPSEIVSHLKTFTQKAQALQAPAQSISVVNGPLLVVGIGPFPNIIRGYAEIVQDMTTSIGRMQGISPIKGSDADAIFDAYNDFARVNEFTFKILTGKAGLFSTSPIVGQPMGAILSQVEQIYDAYTFAIIDALPSHAADVQGLASSLDSAEDVVIEAYTHLSTYA